MKKRQKKTVRFAGLFFSLLLTITLLAPAVSGAEAAPALVLDSPQDLVDFAASVSAGQTYKGQTVTLARDLDMTGVAFTAIGRADGGPDRSRAFQGVFDGGGRRITGLTLSPDPYSPGYAGLFSVLSGAAVHDLDLSVTICGGTFRAMGGLAAVAENARIQNVTVHVYAACRQWLAGEDGTAAAGGLVGRASGLLWLDRCGAQGAIDTVASGVQLILGGLAGRLEPAVGAYVSNCYSTVDLSATGTGCWAGGFAGLLAGSGAAVENCYAAGFMKARGEDVGAFAGRYDGDLGLVNLWYDSDLADAQLLAGAGGGDVAGLTGVGSDELRSEAFLPRLGGAFIPAAGMEDNKGYPVLGRGPVQPTPSPTAAPTETPSPTPGGGSPVTGDRTAFWPWLALLAGCMTALACIWKRYRD